MLSLTVLGGSASVDLGKRISKLLDAKFVEAKVQTFPDGESKITINSKIKSKKIVIVQSLYPPVDTHLVQLLSLIIEARLITNNITIVIPYMGYARQDRIFLSGEIITMKTVAKLITSAGAKRIITVDIHSKMSLSHFKIPTKNISGVFDLADHFTGKKLINPLIVSPDKGGLDRAKKFASVLKLPITNLTKHRDRKTGAIKISTTSIGNIKDRDIIMVDDMISTGNSILKGVQFLKRHRCGRIFVVCTHALLVKDAAKKIRKSGVAKIIASNTIPKSDTIMIDVSRRIADAIKSSR